MTEAVLDTDQVFLSQIARLSVNRDEPTWMQVLRQDALALVREEGLPTPEAEAWRYTNLDSLVSTPFSQAPARKIMQADNVPFLDLEYPRLVFCNGRVSKELADVSALPEGVLASTLSQAIAEDTPAFREHFSKASPREGGVFPALNLALSTEGALIEIPEGVVLDKPIHLAFFSEGGAEPFMIHPRILVLVGRNSQVSIVESHLSLSEGTHFSNSVTEIVAAENAAVDYYKLQREGADAYHIGTVEAWQGRSANVRISTITLGGKLSRNDTRARMAGEGGYVEMNGLFLADHDQHVDNYTSIEHEQPHCSSRELYKGILNQQANAVFRGRIVVAEGAQKTDSKQTNNNLLLSDDARINTMPQLEIYANDVKCTHGATIGQVNDEAMFYLRARGIGKETARNMLMNAFASEVVNKVRFPDIRKQLESFLADWLPGGALLKQ